MKRDNWQVNVHVVFLLVRVGRHLHSLHTTSRGSNGPRVCTHLIHAWSERHSSTLSSPFIQLPLFFILLQSPAVPAALLLPRWYVVTVCTPPTRRWGPRTNPSPTQVMSPRTTTSWRLLSSPSQSPWPSNSSPSNCSSRMWIMMTPRSRRCFITHTENMSITPSEKACLLVSRRRPCPKELGDPLLKEQGDLLWKEVRSLTLNTHRLELFWTDRKSKSSPNVRRWLRNTNSRLIMTEDVYTN